MICGRCGIWCGNGDNYCRRCGDLLVTNLPAVPVEQRLARISQSVPPVVWKGLAALAASKAVEWGVRIAARRLVAAAPAALTALTGKRETRTPPPLHPANHKVDGLAVRVGAVVETVIILRRLYLPDRNVRGKEQ